MTAAPPNDSGAAASRDAARTARRLTDGTLPRRPPTEASADPAPAAAEPPTPTVHPPSPPTPTPTAPPGHPQATPPPTPTPVTPAPATPAPTGPTPTMPTPAGPAPVTPAPVGPAPVTPAPVGPAPATPATGAGPAAAPAPAGPAPVAPVAPPGNPGVAGPTPAAREAGGAVSPTVAAAVEVAPGQATPPAPVGTAGAPEGSARVETLAGPAPAQGSGSPAGSHAAAEPAAPARPGDPVAAAALEPAAREAGAVSRSAAVAPGRTKAPVPDGPRATPAPAGAGPASASAGVVPARAAAAAAAARVAEGSAGAASAGSGSGAASGRTRGGEGVGVFKEERELLDFGRITGMRVASVAVPVAGVGRLPRRKNLIGAETTGSIPVHLLFRAGAGAGAAAVADDGGPDTVAMAPPAARKAKQTVIPRPTTKHARPGPARPAPTADPALVERPAAVLPGWVGIVGGLLALVGCAAVVWWAGAVPAELARMLGLPPRPYHGIHLAQWALLALGVLVLLFAVGGLGRGRVGYAWVLTLFGEYRGTVRRTGLVWASPLLLRRRVDVRLRHWRSEPLPAVDAKGTALDVTVLVVWRVRDTVRAALGVDGHEDYLREQVEAAMARVLSQLPADAFHEDAPTLRDAEAVGEALTRMLSAECAPVGLDVFSAQPTRIEYAPEVAEAMRRRRIAAIDAKHRDSVLTSVVDAVDDVVHRLTSRGLVELDDYERKALVKDLTVAFYTGRGGPGEGA
ncbi:SPFH domain-containing protein [Streptomyces sp. NPDC007863]|uniref:SPFH domain-containing protein n=1 Tax=Streptomyces sp. NPDC007863 TaxID=3154894 RepID=UPI0033CE4B22